METDLSTRSEVELTNALVPSPSSRLRVELVNPLEHEAGIKALMTANGIADFEDFFDRGYPDAVADGAASWVVFDETGRIQMCLTQFVHRFQFYGANLRCSVTGNVVAAKAYRTFFPALALFRRMLSDTRDRGELDFVYGDPTPAASAVCRAAKMDHVGNLDRLVLPIADASFTKNVGARLFSRAPMILGGRMAASVRFCPAEACNPGTFDEPLGEECRVLPRHPVSLLRRRLRAFPGPNDFVVELRSDACAATWDALVLLRLADDTRILSILSVRRRSDVSLRYVIPALVPLARRVGAFRLQCETLLESRMAREFCSLGFRPRGDVLPVFVKTFTAAGKEAIGNLARWEVTTLDMERL